jgi:hypothetical protein
MTRYAKSSFKSDGIVRTLAGSACFAEVAVAAEKWDDCALELLIDPDRWAGYTGIYRKMPKGTLPSDMVCRRVKEVLPNCNIQKWRDHPFWGLLRGPGFNLADVEHALRSIRSDPVRRSVWGNPPDRNQRNSFSRLVPELALIKDIFNCKQFDALIALTAWARETRALKQHSPAFQSAFFTKAIFAEVVCHTPHLFIRWPLLAEQYKQWIWSSPASDTSEAWFDMDWEYLLFEISVEEQKARQRGIKLPPHEIVTRINHPLPPWPDPQQCVRTFSF